MDATATSQLAENLAAVRDRMARAAARAGREASAARLVAVTKKAPIEAVRALAELGAIDLGENYPQELARKVEAMADVPNLRWHLIGHLQGNKARRTLPLVHLIHSVDSLKLLRAIDALAGEEGAGPIERAPMVCLQANVSGEASKFGWSAAGLRQDAEAIASLSRVRVVGLMTIAPFDTDNESARPTFAALRLLRDDLRARTGLALDELSMGMSNDFESAIAEGATLARVGSALFEGVRP
jgi:pyridoxal phosphate enzyme (YggS family)